MKVHNLSDLLACALEGAARYIVAYCDSEAEVGRKSTNFAPALVESTTIFSAKTQAETTTYRQETTFTEDAPDDDIPPPTDSDAPPEKEDNSLFVLSDNDESLEEIDKRDAVSDEDDSEDKGQDKDKVAIDGVPAEHPIHAEVRALLPAFRMISAMVEKDDFAVTPQSVETAMPVWVSFNALSKYREDEHFPAILSYVRSYIKPVCFAAMGKEIGK